MENKQKILKIVQDSQLSPDDQKEWEALAESAPTEFLESAVVILESFPEEIQWFTDAYKKKKSAFAILKEDKVKGEKLLQEIFQEEKEKLQGLANKQA